MLRKSVEIVKHFQRKQDWANARNMEHTVVYTQQAADQPIQVSISENMIIKTSIEQEVSRGRQSSLSYLSSEV